MKVCALFFTLVFGIAGCGGGSNGTPSTTPVSVSDSTSTVSTGTLVFKSSPVAENNIAFVEALGNLNPPGHTFPTDHIYFYYADPDKGGTPSTDYSVYAPASGTVQYVLQPEGDYKLGISVISTMSYYMDHVMLNPGIAAGNVVTAGQVIGTTSKNSYAVDLGVVNTNVTLSFINPARYPDQTLRADAPLKYFEEPLKTTLYAKVRRTGNDKDGKIDFDGAGKLSGNWFLQGLAATPDGSNGADAWTKQIAFVYDPRYPDKIRISIGGTLSMAGVYGVQDTATDPKNVSVSSGKVSYQLYGFDPLNNGQNNANQSGLLVIQMTDDNTIKVETLKDSTEITAEFTSAAQTYVR